MIACSRSSQRAMSLKKFLLCYSIQFCIWKSLYWKLYKVKFQSEYTLEETLYHCRNVVRPILQFPKFKVIWKVYHKVDIFDFTTYKTCLSRKRLLIVGNSLDFSRFHENLVFLIYQLGSEIPKIFKKWKWKSCYETYRWQKMHSKAFTQLTRLPTRNCEEANRNRTWIILQNEKKSAS